MAQDYATPEAQPLLFPSKTPEELQEHIRSEYGGAVLDILERTEAKKGSVIDQQQIVEQLRGAGLNGNAEALYEAYNAHNAEFQKKEIVKDKWYNKVGRGIKETLLAPVRAVKWGFQKHPILTTAALVALAAAGVAGGFYLAGSWELLLTSVGLQKYFAGAEAVNELLPVTPGTPILPGGGTFEIPPPMEPPIAPSVPGTGIIT